MPGDFLVGFVGLPSAGKSTMVNSLVGKRILESGVCRTTTKVHYIGPKNERSWESNRYHQESPMSDDGVSFTILDLPGIADAEDKGKPEENFDEITSGYATECDLICWVSDVRTAFITTYELEAFKKLQGQLERSSLETGTLYQVAIVLSKYDHADRKGSETQQQSASKRSADGEIVDEGEETSMADCFDRVRRVFPEGERKSPRILKFNAHGRVLNSEQGTGVSTALYSLVKKMGAGATEPVNIKWELGWATENLEEKRDIGQFRCLLDFHLRDLTTWNSVTDGSFKRMAALTRQITTTNVLAMLKQLLLCGSQSGLDQQLEEHGIAPGIRYSEDMFNSLCYHLADLKFECLPMAASYSWERFRYFLLLGRYKPSALRMFLAIEKQFSAKVFWDSQWQVVRFDCRPCENVLRPHICIFDDECDTPVIALKSWQNDVLEVNHRVWGTATDDIDPLALAMLVRARALPSLFCDLSVAIPYRKPFQVDLL